MIEPNGARTGQKGGTMRSLVLLSLILVAAMPALAENQHQPALTDTAPDYSATFTALNGLALLAMNDGELAAVEGAAAVVTNVHPHTVFGPGSTVTTNNTTNNINQTYQTFNCYTFGACQPGRFFP